MLRAGVRVRVRVRIRVRVRGRGRVRVTESMPPRQREVGRPLSGLHSWNLSSGRRPPSRG